MADLPASKTLLVVWEAVDWSQISPLLDAGELPNLARLVEQGSLARLDSLAPAVTAPLAMSIATGLRPENHGVVANWQATADGAAMEPVGSTPCRAATLWQLADAAGLRSVVIGWPATQPARALSHGVVVTDAWARPVGSAEYAWPWPAGAVSPARLESDLAELRVHPEEVSGDDLLPFIPGLEKLGPSALATELAFHLAGGASTQCAATYLLENEPWDFAAIYFSAPGAILGRFLDFEPPRLPQISEADFELFRQVGTETLKFHDRMLGRLLELAGPAANILISSPSGWFTGAQRPSLAPGEHAENVARVRSAGWAVLQAPGVRADELLYGAGLLDLAPTTAWLLGLSVPGEWPGREWVHAFHEARPIRRSPPGVPTNPSPPTTAQTAPDPALPAVRAAAVESSYNLARFLLGAGRLAEAVPLLQDCHRAWPDRIGPACHLIPALVSLGQTAAARAVLEELAARPGGGLRPRPGLEPKFPPQFHFMRGLIEVAEGRPADARRSFEAARQAGAQSAELYLQLGRTSLALREFAAAEQSLRQALELEPEHAAVHHALALLYYRRRDFVTAANHALEAALRRTEPYQYHLLLGLALGRAGDRKEAIAALHHALARQPGLLTAHRALVVLHSREPSEAFAAANHRRMVVDLYKRRGTRISARQRGSAS